MKARTCINTPGIDGHNNNRGAFLVELWLSSLVKRTVTKHAQGYPTYEEFMYVDALTKSREASGVGTNHISRDHILSIEVITAFKFCVFNMMVDIGRDLSEENKSRLVSAM